MKINNLSKMQFRDTHKIKDIEEYLESEVSDILSKRTVNRKPLKQTSNLFQNLKSYSDDSAEDNNDDQLEHRPIRNEREQYLPFNKDEIRPIITDNTIKTSNNQINDILLATLMPIIEEWLDNNLERIVHKIVKRSIEERKQQEMEALENKDKQPYYNEDNYERRRSRSEPRERRHPERDRGNISNNYNRYKN